MGDGSGRKPLWTAKQAERVLELAAAGTSQRAIATEVFGDARLHGRVERILGSPPRTAADRSLSSSARSVAATD